MLGPVAAADQLLAPLLVLGWTSSATAGNGAGAAPAGLRGSSPEPISPAIDRCGLSRRCWHGERSDGVPYQRGDVIDVTSSLVRMIRTMPVCL